MKTRIVRLFDTAIHGYVYAIEVLTRLDGWERAYGCLHTDFSEAEIHAKKIANGDMSHKEFFVVSEYECSQS